MQSACGAFSEPDHAFPTPSPCAPTPGHPGLRTRGPQPTARPLSQRKQSPAESCLRPATAPLRLRVPAPVHRHGVPSRSRAAQWADAGARMPSPQPPVKKQTHPMSPFRLLPRQNPSMHLAVIGITLLALTLAGCVSTQTPQQADLKAPHPTYVAMYGPQPDEKFPLPGHRHLDRRSAVSPARGRLRHPGAARHHRGRHGQPPPVPRAGERTRAPLRHRRGRRRHEMGRARRRWAARRNGRAGRPPPR